MTDPVRTGLHTFFRQVAVAVTTAAIIIGGLVVAFQGQSNEERELQTILVDLQRETLEATLAEACVLALPTDPDTGRDPRDVQSCFTQYGLEPPGIIAN